MHIRATAGRGRALEGEKAVITFYWPRYDIGAGDVKHKAHREGISTEEESGHNTRAVVIETMEREETG